MKKILSTKYEILNNIKALMTKTFVGGYKTCPYGGKPTK
jgi:hypothetical protein